MADRKVKIPWGLIRVGVILLLAGLLTAAALPHAEDFVEEANYSKAISKGRVLLRGAQIVATQRLVAQDTHEQAVEYLTAPEHLTEIQEAAGFPVEAQSITAAALDGKGLLSDFTCVIRYEERKYEITLDIPGQHGVAKLLEPETKTP